MNYSTAEHEGNTAYDWVNKIMYESTTLTTKGEVLKLLAVPFNDSGDVLVRYDFCSMDINPCTAFASPVDIYDCDNNLCTEYDYCATILDLVPLDNELAVTDLEWNMCPQAKTNPYVYKKESNVESYWSNCVNYMHYED